MSGPMRAEPKEVPVTAQEQEMFEDAVLMADEMIVGDETSEGIAQTVLASEDLAEGVGHATATVVVGVDKRMDLPEDLLVPLAEEVTVMLLAMASEAGAISEEEIDHKIIERAGQHFVSQYYKMAEAMGDLDSQELEQDVQGAEAMTGTSREQGAPQEQAPQEQQPQGLMMGG